MQKIIGVTELQRHFRAVLDEVVKERVPCLLMRGSRPEAALIPYQDFLRYQRLVEQEQQVQEHWDGSREQQAERTNALSENEVQAEVDAAVRAERRVKERDETAWQEELRFIRQRGQLRAGEVGRRWTREELYDR